MIGLDGEGPLYEQVYRALRDAILDGTMAAGAKLPATRQLASEVGVSRNVALLAYDQLTAEGYVVGRVGAGTFVADDLPDSGPEAASRPARRGPADVSSVAAQGLLRAPALSAWARRAAEVHALSTPTPYRRSIEIDFRYGYAPPDEDLLERWRRSVRHAAQTLARDQTLDYGRPEGLPVLRRALVAHLRRRRGIVCDPEQVLVVAGSQQALDLTTRVLVAEGDPVVLEEPHYRGARAVFAAAGAELVGIDVDGEGLDPQRLEAVRSARLVYVTPSHQFPTGAVLPLARRLALLDWARRRGAYVLEDDYDSDYRYEGRPIEAVFGLERHVAPELRRTIYAGTFSKVLFPALRLGFLVLPEPLVAPFRAAKWISDRQSPHLEQAALADFIERGAFDRHVRRMRRRHALRREALIEALDLHLGDLVDVQGTEAGIHVVVWVRQPQRGAGSSGSLGSSNSSGATAFAERWVRAAAERGVGLHPIAPYFLDRGPRPGLLVGYGALEEEQIRDGVARLAKAWSDASGSSSPSS